MQIKWECMVLWKKGGVLMRRVLKKFICVLVLLTLFACSTENAIGNPKDGVLSPVKQNERNSQIISSFGFDTLLMYDLDIKTKK